MVSGHASGQLCRLRLTVPTAPGADPSQVRAPCFYRDCQKCLPFDALLLWEQVNNWCASFLCMHLSAWLACLKLITAGLP